MLFAFSSQRTTIFGSHRVRKDEPHPLFCSEVWLRLLAEKLTACRCFGCGLRGIGLRSHCCPHLNERRHTCCRSRYAEFFATAKSMTRIAVMVTEALSSIDELNLKGEKRAGAARTGVVVCCCLW